MIRRDGLTPPRRGWISSYDAKKQGQVISQVRLRLDGLLLGKGTIISQEGKNLAGGNASRSTISL